MKPFPPSGVSDLCGRRAVAEWPEGAFFDEGSAKVSIFRHLEQGEKTRDAPRENFPKNPTSRKYLGSNRYRRRGRVPPKKVRPVRADWHGICREDLQKVWLPSCAGNRKGRRMDAPAADCP